MSWRWLWLLRNLLFKIAKQLFYHIKAFQGNLKCFFYAGEAHGLVLGEAHDLFIYAGEAQLVLRAKPTYFCGQSPRVTINPNPFLFLKKGFLRPFGSKRRKRRGNPPPAPSLSREGSNRDYPSLLH